MEVMIMEMAMMEMTIPEWLLSPFLDYLSVLLAALEVVNVIPV